MSIQVQRKHSGLPCAVVRRLIPCSPWWPGFFATIADGLLRQLDASVGASGPHVFAVRDRVVRPHAWSTWQRCRVHRIPHQRVVAIMIRPFGARDDRNKQVIWVWGQVRFL